MVSAYSIGKAQRSHSLQDSMRNPGPGTYQPAFDPLSNKHNSPKWSMLGKKSFVAPKKQYETGPGQYNPKYDLTIEKQPCYRIGSSERPSVANNRSVYVPGPGQYQQFQITTGPKFSMGEKLKEIKHNFGPGPQAYTFKSTILEDAKNIKIGSSQREPIAIKTSTPGPGFYNTNGGFNTPSIRFGQETRDAFGRQRSFSPGPGAYNANDFLITRQSPSFKIGSENRSRGFSNEKPGPGTYDPAFDFSIEKSPSYKIGLSERDSLTKKSQSEIPGPGNYKMLQTFGGPKFSLTGKPKSNTVKKRREVPGPGHYNLNKTNIFPSVKFGSEARETVGRFKSQTPGPGHYEIKTTIADVPSYLLVK